MPQSKGYTGILFVESAGMESCEMLQDRQMYQAEQKRTSQTSIDRSHVNTVV